MSRVILAVLCVVGLALGLAGAAQAGLLTGPGGIMCPTGAHPTLGRDWAAGDTYQLVFVTSTTTQATQTGIAYYNTFVNTAADGSSLTGVPDVTWYAIASAYSPATSARNTAIVSAPVYRLDLALVATGYADIWKGSITVPIEVNENGVWSAGCEYVWTGTFPDGLPLSGRELGGSEPLAGRGYWANGYWMHQTGYTITNYCPLYALSEELTITPEPATLALLGLGGLGMLLGRKRK